MRVGVTSCCRLLNAHLSFHTRVGVAVPGRTLQPTDLLEACSGDLGSAGCLIEYYFDHCSHGNGLRLGLADQTASAVLRTKASLACVPTWIGKPSEWPLGHTDIDGADSCVKFAGGNFGAQLATASLSLLFDGCNDSPLDLLRPARCALQAATCVNAQQTKLKDLRFRSLWDGDPVEKCEGHSVACVVAAAHAVISNTYVADVNLSDQTTLLHCLSAFNDNFQYWFHSDGQQLCQLGIGDPIGINLCSTSAKICPVPIS